MRTLLLPAVLSLAAASGLSTCARQSASPAEPQETSASSTGWRAAPELRGEPGALARPFADAMKQKAPDLFRARFATSRGEFSVEVHRGLAPHGADRFYNLVRHGYFDGARFFRVVPGFVAQFGLHAEPAINEVWTHATIPDDPPARSNARGTLTFATAGPRTRTTQLFLNLVDNPRLDRDFAPFGAVVEGMPVVDGLCAEYGEGPPYGGGPSQEMIRMLGNAYLEQQFPRLDFIRTVELLLPDR